MAHPGGRPTVYKPEYCQMLIDHMASGLSYETFSAVIDTCRATLYIWEKEHPQFLDAKKRGVEFAQIFWEKLGLNSLLNEKQMNSAIYIFTMKNRFKWTDRVEVMPSRPIEIETGYEKLTDEELDKIT